MDGLGGYDWAAWVGLGGLLDFQRQADGAHGALNAHQVKLNAGHGQRVALVFTRNHALQPVVGQRKGLARVAEQDLAGAAARRAAGAVQAEGVAVELDDLAAGRGHRHFGEQLVANKFLAGIALGNAREDGIDDPRACVAGRHVVAPSKNRGLGCVADQASSTSMNSPAAAAACSA